MTVCEVCGQAPTGTRWWVDLPTTLETVTLNSRRDKRTDGKILKQWREAAGWAVKAERVPQLQRGAVIRLHFWPGDRRKRDRVNLALIHKACVDGIVDAGVIEDDSPDHIDEKMPQIHRAIVKKAWRLEIVGTPRQ